MHSLIPRILIGAPASGAGKTTITAGLIAALRTRGLTVQAFKCGPDYIDPSYHELAAGRPCRNLDAWMLGDKELLDSFMRATRDADIAVIEGVMGLFDGCGWEDERGSTAQIAKLLGAPVLLVIDISGVARSASIPVLGCREFDPDLAIGGVVLNLAGSETHALGCAAAITQKTRLPVLGWMPRDTRLTIPERHLGLVPGTEHAPAASLIATITRELAQRFDVAAIESLARGATPIQRPLAPRTAPRIPPRRARRPMLAVARDAAFCFYYPENLELLAEAGCDIEFFAPSHGEVPSRRVAGIYLGGGYPELHAKALAANVGFHDRMRELHANDAPVYAECGGFMVLTQKLVDLEGEEWPMAGLIPGLVRMTGKLAALGYRHATALRSSLLADSGDSLRAHEFRHSHFEPNPETASDDAAWSIRGTRESDAPRAAGFAHGNLLASYLHVHFGQRPSLAERFAERACSGRYRE
jgi:cobyrinic acid a,c-diamide synthase